MNPAGNSNSLIGPLMIRVFGPNLGRGGGVDHPEMTSPMRSSLISGSSALKYSPLVVVDTCCWWWCFFSLSLANPTGGWWDGGGGAACFCDVSRQENEPTCVFACLTPRWLTCRISPPHWLSRFFFWTFYIFLGFCVISPSTHTHTPKKKAGPPLCYSFEFNFNFWNTTVPPLHLFLFLEQGVYCFYEFIAGFLSMFSISVFNDRAFSRWMNYLNSPAQLTGNFLKQFLVHRMWNELSKWKKQTGLSHLFLFIGREPFLCGWPSN